MQFAFSLGSCLIVQFYGWIYFIAHAEHVPIYTLVRGLKKNVSQPRSEGS